MRLWTIQGIEIYEHENTLSFRECERFMKIS